MAMPLPYNVTKLGYINSYVNRKYIYWFALRLSSYAPMIKKKKLKNRQPTFLMLKASSPEVNDGIKRSNIKP